MFLNKEERGGVKGTLNTLLPCVSFLGMIVREMNESDSVEEGRGHTK